MRLPDARPETLFPYADGVLRAVLPGMNRAQRQVAAAIGIAESGFGVAPGIYEQFADTFNWGALRGVGPAGSKPGADHDKDGKLIPAMWRVYPDAATGLIDFMKTWATPDVLAAAGAGSAQDVAAIMYARHYYVGSAGASVEQRIHDYASAIYSRARDYARIMGEPLDVTAPPPVSSGGLLIAAGILVLAAFAGGWKWPWKL